MFRIRCLAVTSLVLMAFVAGCPGPVADLPDLATVSGTVTMGGEPLANVTVEFASANGQAAYGTTDASGQYKLVYSGDAGGAEIGENTVRITTNLDAPAPADYKDPIPAKYNESSELKATVKSGDNTHDFALEP